MKITNRGCLRISIDVHPIRFTNILTVYYDGLKRPIYVATLVDDLNVEENGIEHFVGKAVKSFKAYKKMHGILQHKKLRKK